MKVVESIGSSDLLPDSNNASLKLVVASLKSEVTSWIPPGVNAAVYIVDDPSAVLRPPKNKGNEAMVYLTYIIDHYDILPDISIFAHAHHKSRHTDELLRGSMRITLDRLRHAKVLKDGYFNLRCNWEPGCPHWFDLEHENDSAPNAEPSEARILKNAWRELHPSKLIPRSAAQPYGAQFAASRQQIRSVSLTQWQAWRDWLLATILTDYQSGRVWEYSWQYVLTGNATFCPPMDTCYCEGYGICFGSRAAFDNWWKQRADTQEREMEYLRLRAAGNDDPALKEKIHSANEALRLELQDAMRRGDGKMVLSSQNTQ